MDKVKMWTKIGSKVTLAENNNKRLVDQLFLNPVNGNMINYTLFDCSRPAIIIFPLTINMEVIAIKQFRPGADEIILELPGGTHEPEDESFTKTAQRELTEETGYQSGRLTMMPNKLWPDPSSLTIYFYSFLAQECKKIQKSNNFDGNENTETLLVPLSTWMGMISSGKITDIKTIAITLLAKLSMDRTIR